jgi:histone deacetylase 1/2
MKGPDKLLWEKAIESEYLSLITNLTWDLVKYSGTMKVIGCMWKFKLKRDTSGSIKKYKARMVARGDQQEPDWNSVFAPTVRYTSLRVILAIACCNDWEIEQMDVVSAFLNANVESEIYMEQPEGYIAYGDKGQPLVCHLRKALYGIREAPKAWNSLVTEWLVDYGFTQSLVDPGVFTFNHGPLLYIVALYVDDSILVG